MPKQAGKQSRISRAAIFVLLMLLALLVGRFTGIDRPEADRRDTSGVGTHETIGYLPVSKAFQDRLQNVLVEGSGTVVKVLPDDTKGSRHQRLIVKVSAEQTILIAHNIDLAPRIPKINRGDSLRFRGSYVYNEKGGIIHWTHRDPQGEHPDGWLMHNGKTYD